MLYKRIFSFGLVVSSFLCLPVTARCQFPNAEKDIFSPLKQCADSLRKAEGPTITPAEVLNILDSNPPARVSVALPVTIKKQLLSASALYQQNLAAVGLVAMCAVSNPLRGVQLNHASGFVITADGVFITNYHVLYSYAHSHSMHDWGTLLVRLGNGKVYGVRKILMFSEHDDLAVLQLDVKQETLPYISLAPKDATIGEAIYVLSNSDKQLYSITTGIVSDKYNQSMGGPSGVASFDRNLLSITAEFAVGASGGPILDGNGNLVGIVSSTHVIEQMNTGHPQSQMTIKNAIPVSSLQKLTR
ncbi:Trypsin-like peptidase domain-containing protein [Filimonas lacunae]|uniref:Trypsin-like peptidase domain-containing protein n=1 Tax=Filimonas lacunae TaxID=477680 RepID=A0A173MIA6_9BACT|nr:serine protease [Filimonas lacunae]BAV07354.1 serine protease [Filimonas lacunae]SIS90900.1 Trypsin-like peptidase domain-containing protein [Filimonas lacunae]